MQSNLEIKLAHHAVLNLATGKISVPLGDITVHMDHSEFFEWVMKMQDIALSISTLTEIQTYSCDSCGSFNEVLKKNEGDEN